MLSSVSIRGALRRYAQLRWERARQNPLGSALTTLVILLGLFLRARGYLFQRHGFWLDEAAWAVLLMKKPLVTLLIRPIGFMSLSKLLAVVLGPSEVVLRGISWVAGILVVLLAPALSRRLYRAPMARLLFVAVLALHPAAIDLSKEFKPYSASLCGHLVVLLSVLRYLETQRAKDLLLALVAALVANMFAQDLVMAYPGMFLVLGWDTLTRCRGRLPWVLAGAAALVLALFAQYWFIWRHIASDEATYWGHKYNVFYVEDSQQSHLAWWFGRYGDLAEFPALRHKYWDAPWVSAPGLKRIAGIETVLWWLIHAAGLVALFVRRQFREATLLLMPFVTISVMNALGQWPFGPFRANLFLLAYSAAIAGMAFDWPLASPFRWSAVAPAVVLVLFPLCAFDRQWNARKRALCADADIARVVKALVEQEPEHPREPRQKRTLLFLSGRVCSTYEYYSSVNPRTSQRFHQALRRSFEIRCTRTTESLQAALAESVPAEGHAWLISDGVGGELSGIKQRLKNTVSFDTRFSAPPHELDVLTRVP